MCTLQTQQPSLSKLQCTYHVTVLNTVSREGPGTSWAQICVRVELKDGMNLESITGHKAQARKDQHLGRLKSNCTSVSMVLLSVGKD